MKQFLSLIFILSFCAKYSAQSDTIDYSIFLANNKLSLIRVLEGKDKKQLYFKAKPFFAVGVVSNLNDPIVSKASFLGLTDTMMFSEWDLEKGNQLIVAHSISKVYLKKNILYLKKLRFSGTDYIDPIDRKFEIIKWTKFEIILKDLDYPKLNRFYVFREIVAK